MCNVKVLYEFGRTNVEEEHMKSKQEQEEEDTWGSRGRRLSWEMPKKLMRDMTSVGQI